MTKHDLDPAAIDWDKLDGLVPAVVQDARTRDVLMLGYMNREALEATLADRLVTFFSRSRQRLWRKGETSGNHLGLTRIRLDCDQDTLLIEAVPEGPTCHLGSDTCFGDREPSPAWLALLEATIGERAEAGSAESYTVEMLKGGPAGTARKLGEEAIEVVLAATTESAERVAEEAADLIYHLLLVLKSRDIGLGEVIDVLQKRAHDR
ncbi:MAG: bifunctional phosphoribosyl-AMP cyclohydrolase/phosphoribosyl-ATP diphosphatase HisIE [Proteobacteria bacterium]|nr:bifunctional phosphoribosyl-AMP cyclohydrolase/phosphoribosyl-ATP diphosphatase HisIE [Pseudomonadota bacterium]